MIIKNIQPLGKHYINDKHRIPFQNGASYIDPCSKPKTKNERRMDYLFPLFPLDKIRKPESEDTINKRLECNYNKWKEEDPSAIHNLKKKSNGKIYDVTKKCR